MVEAISARWVGGRRLAVEDEEEEEMEEGAGLQTRQLQEEIR